MTLEKYNEINKQTTINMDNGEVMMLSTYIFKDEAEKKDFIDMYLWVKNTKKVKSAVFKTFDTKKYFIDEYIENWREKILKNCSMLNLDKMFVINSFVVNSYVLNNITEEELYKITQDLLNVFPVDSKTSNKDFNRIAYKAQFKSNTDNLFISDYAITEFKKYIIIWHLDLNNNLGINISSIYKKEDFKLLKPLTTKLKVKVA